MRRKALVAVVLVGLTAASVLGARHVMNGGVSQLLLAPADASIQECYAPYFLEGVVDVVNVSTSTADLYFGLEFDLNGQRVGTVDFIAHRVPAGRHEVVTDRGIPDQGFPFDDLLASHRRVKCRIVGFGGETGGASH